MIVVIVAVGLIVGLGVVVVVLEGAGVGVEVLVGCSGGVAVSVDRDRKGVGVSVSGKKISEPSSILNRKTLVDKNSTTRINRKDALYFKMVMEICFAISLDHNRSQAHL
jgi:hypothetical protein